MPTYVYACKACNKEFELEQRIVEDAIKDCILCHTQNSVKRVIQPVGIAFKGSGFYVNDSVAATAPKESKDTESKDKEAKAEDGKPTEAKSTETTSETKVEPAKTETPAASKPAEPTTSTPTSSS